MAALINNDNGTAIMSEDELKEFNLHQLNQAKKLILDEAQKEESFDQFWEKFQKVYDDTAEKESDQVDDIKQ